ncbi:MAG: DUF6673 family protein [Acutalibacteraceae bacterium]|nr:DUF6673 family protein [Acutalibacteraceae bacterium]
MIIQGVKLPDIDPAELDQLELWELSFETFSKAITKAKTMKKASEAVRSQCFATFALFNQLFGDGTDKTIFGDRTNLVICMEAVQELVTAVNNKDQQNSEKISSFVQKYSPTRATRPNAI